MEQCRLSDDFSHSCRRGDRVLSNYLDAGVVQVSITCNKACLVRGQRLLCPCWRGEEQNPAWAEHGRKMRGTMPLQCGFAKLPHNCCFSGPGGQYLGNAIRYIHHRQSIKSQINSKHKPSGRGKPVISCSSCSSVGFWSHFCYWCQKESIEGIAAAWKPRLLPEKVLAEFCAMKFCLFCCARA